MSHTAAPQQPGLRFGLFGIPVKVDPTFLLVGLFAAQRISGPTGWQGFASWILAVFIGVLVHEFGHALTFRAFGRQPVVTLYALGGLTAARGGLTVLRSLAVSLAGPFAGIAFGGAVWWAAGNGIWPTDALFPAVLADDLIFISLVWGIANLAPLHPLDGGQALESVLRLTGAKRPVRTTSLVSLLTAAAIILWALTVNSIFIVLFVAWMSMANWRRFQAANAEEGRAV